MNWALSWPNALEIRCKIVLKYGFNKRSVSFGTGRHVVSCRKTFQFFCSSILLDKKSCLAKFLGTIGNLPINAWIQNNLDLFVARANLDTNQDTTVVVVVVVAVVVVVVGE